MFQERCQPLAPTLGSPELPFSLHHSPQWESGQWWVLAGDRLFGPGPHLKATAGNGPNPGSQSLATTSPVVPGRASPPQLLLAVSVTAWTPSSPLPGLLNFLSVWTEMHGCSSEWCLGHQSRGVRGESSSCCALEAQESRASGETGHQRLAHSTPLLPWSFPPIHCPAQGRPITAPSILHSWLYLPNELSALYHRQLPTLMSASPFLLPAPSIVLGPRTSSCSEDTPPRSSVPYRLSSPSMSLWGSDSLLCTPSSYRKGEVGMASQGGWRPRLRPSLQGWKAVRIILKP